MSFDTGRLSPVSAASAVCSAVDSNQPRVGGDGVAFFDEDDVAGHELGRRDALPLAVADDVRVRRRHLAQRRHRLLRARLLDVAHDRVEQHDGEDRDRLVGQRRVALVEPQSRRDRRRDEQQDDEHVLELGEELPPRRHRLFRGQLVPAVAFEPRPRLFFAQALLRIRAQRSQHFIDALEIAFDSLALNRGSAHPGSFSRFAMHSWFSVPLRCLTRSQAALIRPMWRRCLPRFGTIAAARHGHRSQMR